jgi:hypothetical protein
MLIGVLPIKGGLLLHGRQEAGPSVASQTQSLTLREEISLFLRIVLGLLGPKKEESKKGMEKIA